MGLFKSIGAVLHCQNIATRKYLTPYLLARAQTEDVRRHHHNSTPFQQQTKFQEVPSGPLLKDEEETKGV